MTSDQYKTESTDHIFLFLASSTKGQKFSWPHSLSGYHVVFSLSRNSRSNWFPPSFSISARAAVSNSARTVSVYLKEPSSFKTSIQYFFTSTFVVRCLTIPADIPAKTLQFELSQANENDSHRPETYSALVRLQESCGLHG